MLRAEGISKSFGGLIALKDVSLELGRAEILGLIGPNGSGKTTLLNILAGSLNPDSGCISMDDRPIRLRKPSEADRHGLRRTFQLPPQPTRMTVLETMLCGVRQPLGASVRGAVTWHAGVRREEAAAVAKATDMLAELDLLSSADRLAGLLSGGQRKLLSLGVVLMGAPRILLLDEPAAGVSPPLRARIAAYLRGLRDRGVAAVVVEHDIGFIGNICDRCVVLDRGEVIARCLPSELADNERVVSAYLGGARRKSSDDDSS